MEIAVKEGRTETEFGVSVLYNGIPKTILVKKHETVQAALTQAINAFGPLPNPHTLALFTESGHELNEQQTIEEAGIRPGAHLLLRPSQVRGGAL